MKYNLLYTSLTILFAGSLAAQEKTSLLDPVVVSGSLSPESVSATGRNIQVFERQDIMQIPAASLDEILRYLPGVEVQNRGPLGAQGDITLRGATFQQVLIILDGVRLNDPLTGHFNSYIPLAPADIERIEILKGSSSALYGTEAVGGVINIISRTFAQNTMVREKAASAETGIGEFNLMKNRAGLRLSNKLLALEGSFLQNKTSGQLLRGARSFADLKTLTLSASARFSETTRLSFRYSGDFRSFNAQNFYTQLLSDTATESVRTHWMQTSLMHEKERHRFRLDAGFKQVEDSYRFNRLSTANLNNSSLAQAQLTHQYRISDRSTLSSGLQWISRGIESNNRGNHLLQYGAAFMVLNQRLGADFHLSPSIRAEFNERSKLEINPQLQLSWKKQQMQWRLSAGRSTREADFTERFNNYQAAFVKKGGRIGNPNLNSERAWSGETGLDWFAEENWRISGSGFLRYHRDLIDYEVTPYAEMPRKINLDSTGTYSLAKNIRVVQTRGLELDVQYRKKISAEQSISGTAGLVWLQSNSDGKTPSLYVSNHARFLGNFSLGWQSKWLCLNLNGLYKVRAGQQAIGLAPLSPDYLVFNLRIDWTITGASEGFLRGMPGASLYFQADNLLNQKYADILGPQMPGRWLSGGLRIQLGS